MIFYLRKRLRLLWIVALLAAAALAAAWFFGQRAFSYAQEGRAHLSRAQTLLRARDFKGSAAEFALAAQRFENSSRIVGKLQYLQAVPGISRQYKAARSGLVAAVVASKTIEDTLRAFAPIYGPFQDRQTVEVGDLPKAARQKMLGAIAEALPTLRQAQDDLNHALVLTRSARREGLYRPLKEELDELEGRVALTAQLLADGLPLLEIAPSLLGYPEQKSYLFILQNSAEMRPTGGFIGTFGELTFDAGHITEFFTDDVYNLDRFSPPATRPSAPAPIAQYLQQPRFYLRDANFDPDFPTSAQTVLQFYREEKQMLCDKKRQSMIHDSCLILHDDIDGVIAIMPEAVRPLLEIVGPITVEGQQFTAQNLTDALEYEVEIKFERRGIPRPQRKAIISKLAHALIAKVMALPASRWPEALHAVRASLEERHILLYAADPLLQERLAKEGWAGKINPGAADYLAVFDANLFSLKTDPYVSRSIFYAVRRVSGQLIGEAEIVYAYPAAGPFWKTKGYRSWTRVYVPKGSILTATQGAMEEEGSSAPGRVQISQQSDATVFEAFLAVQVGEIKRLRFTYRLPDELTRRVEEGAYQLLAQKQPGTLGHSLTVSADFGKVPKLWEPRGLQAARDGTRISWQTSLRRDQMFSVEF